MVNTNNTILIESKKFAVRIIRLYQYLTTIKKEVVLSKQLLRSGTSIGANVRESINAQSTMDFIHKMSIALKEGNETEYWLELLHETGYIDEIQFASIYSDCSSVVAILTKIVKTSKEKA